MKKYFLNYLGAGVMGLMLMALTSCRNDRNNTNNSDPYTQEGTYDRTDPLNEENGPVTPENNTGTNTTDQMNTETGRMDDTTSVGNQNRTGGTP